MSDFFICRKKGRVAASFCQYVCPEFDPVREDDEDNHMISHGNSRGTCKLFGRVDEPLKPNEMYEPTNPAVKRVKMPYHASYPEERETQELWERMAEEKEKIGKCKPRKVA